MTGLESFFPQDYLNAQKESIQKTQEKIYDFWGIKNILDKNDEGAKRFGAYCKEINEATEGLRQESMALYEKRGQLMSGLDKVFPGQEEEIAAAEKRLREIDGLEKEHEKRINEKWGCIS